MQEQNLIFLISQPRSGSTFVQKILGSHPEILTLSEPWFMLSLAYTLKDKGIFSEYDKKSEYIAVREFLNSIPKGRKLYVQKIKQLCLEIYGQNLINNDKRIFLDKTPRYYFIINELLEIFPKSKIILLRRNPLSILHSIYTTWTQESWFRLSDFRHDLLDGLFLLNKAPKSNQLLSIKYEDLLLNPKKEFKRLSSFIAVDYDNNMLSYNNSSTFLFGDKSDKILSGRINQESPNGWESSSLSYQQWRVLWDYLQLIGEKEFAAAGYDYRLAQFALTQNMPTSCIEAIYDDTYSLRNLLDHTKNSLYDNLRLQKNVELLEKQLDTQRNELKMYKYHHNSKNNISLKELLNLLIKRIINKLF
ncbi:sulfotransferase family protein [Desulfosediminicola sp.]|uniref:sulfotransferase family protein n=1 Tax=Desulfosediminicola sp. TaxID=2886825 RepID=UPI003AF27158